MGRLIPIALLVVASGCATQQNKTLSAHLKGALDMTAMAVNPSYGYAMQACAVRDTQLTDVITHKLAEPEAAVEVAKAEKELNLLRDRCERTRSAFETIRAAHEQAIELLKQGYPERAEVLLEQIKDGWDMLKGGA